MAPNKAKQYCKRISRNEFMKKTEHNTANFWELPPRVKLPNYPIPEDLARVVTRNLEVHPNMSIGSIKFLSILEKIKNGEWGVEQKNYLRILKLMVHVETIQLQMDMKRYDQENIRVERLSQSLSDRFKIYVKDLQEGRPSVRPEDVIEVRKSSNKKKYLMKVVNVAKDYVLAAGNRKFVDSFSNNTLFDVRFRLPDYPTKCSHYAITLTELNQISSFFFPNNPVPILVNSVDSGYWYNKSVENNPQQKQAVMSIVAKSSGDAPYILYGPPGTGKTATLVEAICQITSNSSCDTHILVCTPSNSAVDEITKRLLKYISDENSIYRMYSPSKEGSTIDDAIVGCSNYVDGQVMMLPADAVKRKSIVLCTLCAATRLLFMGFKDKHFSYILIDEAGQSIEPDTLIPINLLTSTSLGRIGKLHGQVVIAGDPNQLGPCIMSKLAEPILGQSLLERMMQCKPYKKNEHGKYNPSFITKLLRNYRSHPEIIRVSNTLYYEGELQPCADKSVRRGETWNFLPNKNFPIIFHGVQGAEQTEPRSPSIYNTSEIKVVMDYVKRLVGIRLGNKVVRQCDIGIITPFAEQKAKLQRELEHKRLGYISVGTVELFQGQERDIIIMSTVRSKIFKHDERYHIGFLSNPKRFNVALTRAKILLIVIGDPSVLQIDEHWRYFLKFCQVNKACQGLRFSINEGLKEISNQIKDKNKKPKKAQITCDLSVVNINDGVTDSEESESESKVNNYYHLTNRINGYAINDKSVNNYLNGDASSHNRNSSNPRRYYNSNGNVASTGCNLLSDLVEQKFQALNLGDTNAPMKQKKWKKKKYYNSSEKS